MARAMSGHLHEIIKEKTDIDTRGFMDPFPLIRIRKLITIAKIKRKYNAVRLLREIEKNLLLKQNSKVATHLKNDVSFLGYISGNKKMDEGVDDNIA